MWVMRTCSLAIDIGASSGRLVTGFVKDGLLQKTEIHRFENALIEKGGYICWDIQKLYEEIKVSLRKCEKRFMPETIDVDTWAVGFVLLDENDELIIGSVSYRGSRTDGIIEEVLEIMGRGDSILRWEFNFKNSIYAGKNTSP